jgi:hypothetical protein
MAQEGVTHLYLQTTGNRFYGQHILDTILAQAHNLGIAVISWDFPPLYDESEDALAAQASLTFKTPLGARVDGLVGDFEDNLAASAVGAYSRTVRAAAGPGRAYVAAIYPPQDGFVTPLRTLAKYVNVIAPMDYWLTEKRLYTYTDAYHYVADSIQSIRQQLGTYSVPIAVIAQTQDVIDASGFGPYNPPVSQIDGAVAAAKAYGAIGLSFYDLRTQTPAQIAAIAALKYPPRS